MGTSARSKRNGRQGTALVATCILSAAGATPSWAATAAPTFANLTGEVTLDNERVRVEKFVIAPGQSTGRHSRSTDQLLVFIKGGVLKLASGRSVLWKEGRVEWQDATDSVDPGSTNAGSTPIVLICVSLKPVASSASGLSTQGPQYSYLNYPNIPGEDLLENEHVIVQRFTVNPGQWEGRHAHHPNMLYIHVKGGHWAARSNTEPEHAYPTAALDGEVGWMPTIEASVGHESGNIGKEPIDLIWVTLKK